MNYFKHLRGEGARQNISVRHLVVGGWGGEERSRSALHIAQLLSKSKISHKFA